MHDVFDGAFVKFQGHAPRTTFSNFSVQKIISIHVDRNKLNV